ncbi:hypothetical protein [Roseateles sp.]|uniref:hypothetical protein n=1 Tax=Roseateles sp. TaxID=1971397 RepID=UPI003BA7B871
MNRLQQELQRLYGPQPLASRAAMLALSRPADWLALGALWRGVQADLGLPAPAIAVSGRDGYQLWFALAEEEMGAQAHELLQALCQVYLPEVAATRLGICGPASAAQQAGLPLPPQLVAAGQWSAFVAADLAPVFSEEPWLDTEPGPDAQAEVLGRLHCISRVQLDAALALLKPQLSLRPQAAQAPVMSDEQQRQKAPPKGSLAELGSETDPRRFLLRVMNDEQVALSLRIEAAKALLTQPN